MSLSALSAIECMCQKQFVKSLPAMSMGDLFSMNSMGGTVGGGLGVKTALLCQCMCLGSAPTMFRSV